VTGLFRLGSPRNCLRTFRDHAHDFRHCEIIALLLSGRSVSVAELRDRESHRAAQAAPRRAAQPRSHKVIKTSTRAFLDDFVLRHRGIAGAAGYSPDWQRLPTSRARPRGTHTPAPSAHGLSLQPRRASTPTLPTLSGSPAGSSKRAATIALTPRPRLAAVRSIALAFSRGCRPRATIPASRPSATCMGVPKRTAGVELPRCSVLKSPASLWMASQCLLPAPRPPHAGPAARVPRRALNAARAPLLRPLCRSSTPMSRAITTPARASLATYLFTEMQSKSASTARRPIGAARGKQHSCPPPPPRQRTPAAGRLRSARGGQPRPAPADPP
jgi:hypothetical protein